MAAVRTVFCRKLAPHPAHERAGHEMIRRTDAYGDQRRPACCPRCCAGLEAPYSCREDACSACVCSLRSGRVILAHNEILTDDDLAEGYIPACRAEPVSDEVAIEY